MQELLRLNADVDRGKSKDGITALYSAAQHGCYHVLVALLRANADPNKGTSERGTTPVDITLSNRESASRTLMGCPPRHSVFSRGGSLLASIYADAPYIDAAIVSKAVVLCSSRRPRELYECVDSCG